MKRLFYYIIRLIRPLIIAWHRFTLKKDLKIAIKAAKELRYKNQKKYMVIYLQGEFRIFEKQQLKRMILEKKFKRGVTIKDFERSAYYITD